MLRELPFWEIIKTCRISKSFSNICKSDMIWKYKLKQLYPDLIEMKPDNKNYYEYYMELISYLENYYNDIDLYSIYNEVINIQKFMKNIDNDVLEYYGEKMSDASVDYRDLQNNSIIKFSIDAINNNRLDILFILYLYIGYSVTYFVDIELNKELEKAILNINNMKMLTWLYQHSSLINEVFIEDVYYSFYK